MEVPNTDTALNFQTYQVDKITTDSTVQPEVLNITFLGGSSGLIQFSFNRVNPSTGAVTYSQAANISYGAS